MIDALSDPDLVRELIALKAKELGLDREGVDELDALVCKLLDIEFPYPFTSRNKRPCGTGGNVPK